MKIPPAGVLQRRAIALFTARYHSARPLAGGRGTGAVKERGGRRREIAVPGGLYSE